MLAEVGTDGRVEVTEKHTFTWQKQGHGAYLDIPMDSGVRVDNIALSEEGRAYRRGRVAAVGVDQPAGTFGTACCEAGQQRVTWYFSAGAGSTRHFTIRYTLHGAVTAYSDQAFVKLPVWGGNWSQTLDLLLVEIRLPRGGDGDQGVLESAKEPALAIDASARMATMAARHLTPGRTHTAELAFPRGLLDRTPGSATVRSGSGATHLSELRAMPTRAPQAADQPIQISPFRWGGLILLALVILGGIVSLFVMGYRDRRADRRASHSSGAGVPHATSYGGSSSGTSSGGTSSGGSPGSSGGGGGGAW
ncbi:DUF2207 domain-containing protein [Nonomuraea sp. NPDC002799]